MEPDDVDDGKDDDDCECIGRLRLKFKICEVDGTANEMLDCIGDRFNVFLNFGNLKCASAKNGTIEHRTKSPNTIRSNDISI